MKDVLARGGTTEDALTALRVAGACIFDSVKVVMDVQGISLGEATWGVDGSRAWADGQRDRQALRDRLVEMVAELDEPDTTVTITDETVEIIVKTRPDDAAIPTRSEGPEPSAWLVLDHFERFVADLRPGLEMEGFTVAFHRPTAQHDKAGAWVDLDTATALAQVTVWDTGETDVAIGSIEAGAVFDQRSMVLTSSSELHSLLTEIVETLRGLNPR
jgi:hypothetical protein